MKMSKLLEGLQSEAAGAKAKIQKSLESLGWKDGNATGRKFDNVYVYDDESKPKAFFLFRGDRLIGAVKTGEGEYVASNLIHFNDGEKAPVVWAPDGGGYSEYTVATKKSVPAKNLPKA